MTNFDKRETALRTQINGQLNAELLAMCQTESSLYYDKEGSPLDLAGWCARMEDPGYKRVSIAEVCDVRVSTVWLGLDHSWGGKRPLIFETMIFGGPYDGEQDQYSTLEEAVTGHKAMVQIAFGSTDQS